MSHLSRRGADDGERECTSHNSAHKYEVFHATVLRCCFALEDGRQRAVGFEPSACVKEGNE